MLSYDEFLIYTKQPKKMTFPSKHCRRRQHASPVNPINRFNLINRSTFVIADPDIFYRCYFVLR